MEYFLYLKMNHLPIRYECQNHVWWTFRLRPHGTILQNVPHIPHVFCSEWSLRRGVHLRVDIACHYNKSQLYLRQSRLVRHGEKHKSLLILKNLTEGNCIYVLWDIDKVYMYTKVEKLIERLCISHISSSN